MHVELDTDSHSFKIQQKITYFNRSQDTLNSIYLHDWNNAFSNKNTALGKRFVENHNKKFFFAKDKDRGETNIKNIVLNHQTVDWNRPKDYTDAISIEFKKALLPRDSIDIELSYTVKIPHAKFTSYGVENKTYNLRYWYLQPAVYNQSWQLIHHLDMDDLYQNQTDYTVTLLVPQIYKVASNLNISKETKNRYILHEKNVKDFQLHLSTSSEFNNFQTKKILVSTNLNDIEIGTPVKTAILNRQLSFLEERLGNYRYTKLFVNKTSYEKNPLYGMNQLPSFLRPFSDTFEWDLRMFKTITQQYINNSLPSQSRTDTWLRSGIHSYMIMQYVETFYPEVKLIGSLSKIWGIRSYHLSELDFNEKYSIVYQYATRSNLDQALTTVSDSLTNFNRLIFNKYKAGIGLQYLNNFLGDSIVDNGIKNFFKNKTTKNNSTNLFKNTITTQTDKDVSWFFNAFLETDKKIDYSLKIHNKTKDSITLRIKNKRSIAVPISLYSINNDSIQSKICLTGIDSIKNITVQRKNIDYWMLNYEGKIPEVNLSNNRKNNHWSLINKPLKIKWLKDAYDPNYTQLFLEPKADYNYYDGLIIASSIKNKSSLRKKFDLSITPAYSFKSQSLTGSFKAVYHKYIENQSINSYRFGILGSYFHYQPDLAYKKLQPYAQIFFKRKNLRSVKDRAVSISFTMVDKEIDLSENNQTELDKYSVLNLHYVYSNPEIIDNFTYFTDLEIGSMFSKLTTDIRIRKLTNSKRQFDARFFGGVFLYNKTTSDFFSYGVNRPTDYLFRYRYYGRDESEGILSQQIIINDGGFKSQIPVGFANQWITSFNTSIGIWRWFEIYNDVGLVKNRDKTVYFVHDKGIRLNFVHNILEIYFPMHSNNGWEVANPHYEEKIRFVFNGNFTSIYNFLRRGFM